MRRERIKSVGEGYYHIISRCAMEEFLIDDFFKDVFVDNMRRCEAFSGVEVINYCVMSNHFHLLVRVPDPSVISEDELLERMMLLYGNTATWSNNATVPEIKTRWERLRKEGDLETVEKEQAVYRRRMGDLTQFVQNLKQRFGASLRAGKNLTGTIWSQRYSSVVVEGSAETLSIISAYIDLNPVRAGLVSDPRDYKWSGYGSATRGDKRAMAGLVHIYDRAAKYTAFKKIEQKYKEKLYIEKGTELTPEQIREAIDNDGDLPLAASLRYRVRSFSKGTILGSGDFVESVVNENSDKLGDRFKAAFSKRQSSKEQKDRLFSARDLQINPEGPGC